MVHLPDFKPLFNWRKVSLYALALMWCLGLTLGTLYASRSKDSLVSMMRQVVNSRVSIVSLMAGAALLFFLTACAVWISKPWPILVICFLKGFTYAFCAHGTVLMFSSAFWLFRLFLFFTDNVTVGMLLWFWVRHISGFRDTAFRDLIICILTVLIAGIFDICLISPFLVSVL